jgi:hypothetical protein
VDTVSIAEKTSPEFSEFSENIIFKIADKMVDLSELCIEIVDLPSYKLVDLSI